MKSKLVSYSHSQNSHATPANNNTNGSHRTRNESRCTNIKYSTVLISSKIAKREEHENDICNNNDEDVVVDNEYDIAKERTLGQDNENNNNLANNDTVSDDLVEETQQLNIESGRSSDSSSDNIRNVNDEYGNNADIFIEADNGGYIDEEVLKLSGSIPENRTNLIVNYLPQNMSQEEMRMLFSNIGEVESCKLIRDKTTGQSLSYGFVNYQDPKDASDAIIQFNGLRLQNKVIKVSLARPSSETIKGANLYICGLPKSMSQIELEQLFSQYGTIITCRILIDNVTGNSKGVAFIRFDQRNEAETAIKKLNGHTPPNGTEPITVKLANTPFNINNTSVLQLCSSHNQSSEYATTSPNSNNPIPQTNGVRCMMPNIRNMITTCSDIIPRLDMVLQNNGHPSSGAMAPEYVQASNVIVPNSHQMTFAGGQIVCPPQMHPMATFPMSYPCIQSLSGSPDPRTVQSNALVPINGNHPQPQYISIDPLTASTHIIESNLCCLIVCNLSPEAKEGTLWQTFGPFGAVHSVSLARDHITGKCRGFGFVNMPNYHEAISATQHLNGNSLDNRILQIALSSSLKLPTINQYVLPSVAP